jgi:hypothetical protein
MNRIFGVARIPLLIPMLALCGVSANAQAPESLKSEAELKKAVMTLDAAVFDAFNRCDLEKFGGFFVDNLEFYHDKDGLILGKQKMVDAVKNNICGKMTRELIPGTLEVYRLEGYGVLEIGVHRFHHPGHDDTEPLGEGKFIHLWQYKDGTWKITKVFSYDHHALAK